MSLFPPPAPVDPKQKARQLQARLQKGLDLIQEAEAADRPGRKEALESQFSRLEEEYEDSKTAYAKAPGDRQRCPNCRHLGKGVLYEVNGLPVICDSPCPKND